MITQWQDTKDKLDNLRSILHEQRGVRNQLLKSKQEETNLLNEHQELKKKSEKANLFLLSEITSRRKKAVSAIENIGSSSLKMAYGDGYSIKFYDFEDVRKAGSNTFKMDIQMVSPYGKNGKFLVTKLFGSRGGGGIEFASFSLRQGALDWFNYKGPILLDEAFKSMSKDKKIHDVARWMTDLYQLTERQTIFATHMADVFGGIADNIIYVQNDFGKSTVRTITVDELLVLQLDDEDSGDI